MLKHGKIKAWRAGFKNTEKWRKPAGLEYRKLQEQRHG
jgi:hypothetical protein